MNSGGTAPLDNNGQKVCNQGAFFHKEGCFVREIPLDSDICAEMFLGMGPWWLMEWLMGPWWADSQ